MRFRSTSKKSTMKEPSTSTVKVHPLLQRLQTRKLCYNKTPSKDTIMRVLKRQIIPMFAPSDSLHKNHSSYSFLPSFKSSHSKLRSIDSETNFSYEHSSRFRHRKKKISDLMITEIRRINRDTNHIREKLDYVKNDYSNTKDEIASLKQQIIIAQSYKEMVKLKTSHKKKGMKHSFEVFTRTKKISAQLDGIIKRNEATKNDFVEEKALAVIVNKREVQVNHWRSVFNLSNIIMGEQLRALFNGLRSKSSETYKEFCSLSQLLIQQETKMLPKRALSTQSLDYILSKGILSSFQYKNHLKEIKKVLKKLDEVVDMISHELSANRMKINRFLDKTPKLEVEHDTLYTEFLKHKKEFIKKRKVHSYVETKKDVANLCRNCGQSYTESENFEWSCTHHTSEFKQVYWCCGATKHLAPGCKKSKHLSLLDDRSEFEDSLDGEAKCTSCLKTGHYFKECPHDPNNRNFNSFFRKYQVTHFEHEGMDESFLELNNE